MFLPILSRLFYWRPKSAKDFRRTTTSVLYLFLILTSATFSISQTTSRGPNKQLHQNLKIIVGMKLMFLWYWNQQYWTYHIGNISGNIDTYSLYLVSDMTFVKHVAAATLINTQGWNWRINNLNEATTCDHENCASTLTLLKIKKKKGIWQISRSSIQEKNWLNLQE